MAGKPWYNNGIKEIQELNPMQLRKRIYWKIKAETSNYYKNAIYTWTILDVKKQEYTKKNHLNYKAIY